MIINLLVMRDSWWRCWCCQDSVKLHWFPCRLRGSAYETQWVTSQQDHGDLEGGAPFLKVRKYLSACLLSTHRFAIWRYPDTGWWWRQRKQRPVKMNKSEQYWSWPADWFISFTRHYLHLIETLTHFCRCDADRQNACTLLKMHQECISPWILVGFTLLSLFWKHQPRSCISPMSSWSALTPGAGRSVKSSSADEREGVCWWCQIPCPFSAFCYGEVPFPSRLSRSMLQHVLGTVLSLWAALQVPAASRKNLWGVKQRQVPAAQQTKYILRVIHQE